MRQVSITQHANAPTTVYIDGEITEADNPNQIGAVLAEAGINPNQRVNVMNERGLTSQVLAAQFLPTAPVK